MATAKMFTKDFVNLELDEEESSMLAQACLLMTTTELKERGFSESSAKQVRQIGVTLNQAA